ncbi:VanW family protein [uncultured Adlercreutzia sp.]|uniref:VanW family protein n=1 Tax=uncultured Adlercreutzia sp. TaxID=875803 RepID=UPI00267641C0|nr:VanW family protein [uncultured Adlercreutzia sp.]
MAPRRDSAERPRPTRRAAGSLSMPSVRDGRTASGAGERPSGAAAREGAGRPARPDRPSSPRPRPTSSQASGSAPRHGQDRPSRAGSHAADASRARHAGARPERPTAAGRPSRPGASTPPPRRPSASPAPAAGRRARRGGAPDYASPRIQHSPIVQPRRRRKLPVIAVTVVLLAGLLGGGAWAADRLINDARIYAGISIGSVDVSGMTVEEARAAVSEAYGDRASRGRAVVYASEEARASVDVEAELAEQEAQAEQLSVEEARADKLLWVAEAGTLGAHLPVSELVDEAFAIGRDGDVAARIDAAREGRSVPVRLAFDEEAVEALASDIDATIGEPRQDWDVAVEEGQARLVEGHEGTIVDRAHFTDLLTEGFLGDDPENVSFVAEASYAPLRIDEAGAEKARAAIQAALDTGASFSFEGTSWTLSGQDLGNWIATEVRPAGEGYVLAPVLDEKTARADLIGLIRDAGFASAVTVSFDRADGEVWVSTGAGSRYPLVADALAVAREALFGEFDRSGTAVSGAPSVEIGWGDAPARATFDEAVDLGLIGEIASFTTEYNDGAGTANRRHNIHHAADRLTDSVAEANGGTWSFNDVMGEANEANGFQAAHAIVNGEYEDAIGGGICQVATTVFNAVFEAGFPVTERRNHSLYISSYPTGRDAAIAYPDLDLSWVNDSSSDVLVRTRYTDTTLTVTLYGIDPGYVVTAQTGDWEEGEAYKTRTKVDESEPAGTRYVKTKGADGRRVTVHRIVRDRAGNLLHEEDFVSNYAPIDEVIVEGPNAPGADAPAEEEADDGEAHPDEGKPWDEITSSEKPIEEQERDLEKEAEKDKAEESDDDKEDARVSTGD